MIAAKSFLNPYLKNEICDILNPLKNDSAYFKVATDTRAKSDGHAFIAIQGEKYDAFTFLKPLLKNIPLVIYQQNEKNLLLAKEWSKEFPETTFVAVKNSVTYLQKLASVHVRDWYANTDIHHLIAISGSNGKTTTKEMLYHLLKNTMHSEVIATQKNNNNHIGVPLTIFDIDPRKTKAAVVEFGSNHPGEMKVLCDLAFPNVGITTNIGHTHMEFFSELKDVFIEEGLIFEAVMKETNKLGIFLINDDDEFLKTFPNTQHSLRFSTINKNAQVFYSFDTSAVNINFNDGKNFKLRNDNITGRHNFLNLANAFVIAQKLFPSLEKNLIEAATSFHPTPNRSQWISFEGKDVFLDAYNANPSSMKAALLGFLETAQSQKITKENVFVVVGEMKELGAKAPQYHGEFAGWIKTLDIPHIFYIGDFHDEVHKNAPHVQCFRNVEEAQNSFLMNLKKSQKCFIKASRSLQLERLVGITKG
jgi:UDP-N-acetylmuramoyl-tripeptide--D-alanyl-D-alanine ligase